MMKPTRPNPHATEDDAPALAGAFLIVFAVILAGLVIVLLQALA